FGAAPAPDLVFHRDLSDPSRRKLEPFPDLRVETGRALPDRLRDELLELVALPALQLCQSVPWVRHLLANSSHRRAWQFGSPGSHQPSRSRPLLASTCAANSASPI